MYEVPPLSARDRVALMGWRIAEDVQKYAPASLTWRELYVACVLANVANEDTRICRPGLQPDDELAARLRITDKRELLRVIERLIEAKVIERAQRGQKHRQAEYRFLALGPADASQCGETTHAEQPQDGESAHPENGSGWGFSALRVGDSPRQGGGNPHPSQGPKEIQDLSPVRRIVRSASAVAEEEEERFIEWITTTYKPKSAAWWRTVAASGDMPTRAAEWRAATGQSASPGNGQPGRTRWCGQCSDETARQIELADGRLARCPTCHPLAARAA